LPNTGERREIRSRANAHEADVIQNQKKLQKTVGFPGCKLCGKTFKDPDHHEKNSQAYHVFIHPNE